jgi:hypothetical protein
MCKIKIELTPFYIDVLSCYTMLFLLGFDRDSLNCVAHGNTVDFVFAFGSDEFSFEIAQSTNKDEVEHLISNWKTIVEYWIGLPEDEQKRMIAGSRVFESDEFSEFLDMLATEGHLPSKAHDGSSNLEEDFPCPFCKVPLHGKWNPGCPTVIHDAPVCNEFNRRGGTDTLDHQNAV